MSEKRAETGAPARGGKAEGHRKGEGQTHQLEPSSLLRMQKGDGRTSLSPESGEKEGQEKNILCPPHESAVPREGLFIYYRPQGRRRTPHPPPPPTPPNPPKNKTHPQKTTKKKKKKTKKKPQKKKPKPTKNKPTQQPPQPRKKKNNPHPHNRKTRRGKKILGSCVIDTV